MNKELICINCPMGCPLIVELKEGEIINVTGNTCKRGEVYARKELTNPTRIVTSTVKVINGVSNTVSVKTKADIPKEKIFDCVKELKDISITAPINIGEVIVANVADTGIDIVATKTILGKC